MVSVNPADVRFTQESIACHFKEPYEHFSINEALKRIQTGQMSPDEFPRIRVISHEGCLWSVDNRRLWVFRKANCSQITVRMMTTMHQRLEELISCRPGCRSSYMKLYDEDFFPRVRRSQTLSPGRSVAQKGRHPRVAEVMSRYGLLERGRGSQNVLPMPRVHASHPKLLLPCSSTTGLQTESLNAKACLESFSTSSSLAAGGGHDSAAVTTPQPALEPVVDIHYCPGTDQRWSHLEKLACEQTPLRLGSTHDGARSTQSWFGWARNLIFGCFGCE